jgi:uroporphyrinogen decarboxylase
MNSRERIEAAFTHGAPDRTPTFEYVILSGMAGRLLGRRCFTYDDGDEWVAAVCELGWLEALRQYITDRLDLAQLLGHDLMYIMPAPPPPTNGAMPSNDEPSPDDPVERVRHRTKQGCQLPLELHEDSMSVYLLMREEMERRDMDLPMLAPACAHGIWTDVDLMETMLLEPEVAHEHFALATRRSLAWTDQYLSVGVDQVSVGGDFAGNRPLISPQAYREFIMPGVKEVTNRVHEGGRRALNASDGDLWPVIDDFLNGCGVDGYLEIDRSAGMDLRRLKQEFGDHITLYGNMDCGLELSYYTPEEIRRLVIDCIEAGAGNGGHVFCASNAITASIPLANYVAMVDAYREVFTLPKLRAV